MKFFSNYLPKHGVLNSFVHRVRANLYIKAVFEDHIKSEYQINSKRVTTAREYHNSELNNCINVLVCLQ